ncbi:hypothetical protein DLAC_04802 [Tieghemostelium lacteum]|uniref:Uncharacterized protein n=1 Tax=Tieghemostelium lacteum TaxID=361077 RepID=A0A151ZKP2_TIELA|nr:hypothetical protein DLAC_04802 [Tieghemostelium lacteum]|eukprot:KYQ94496.1 hypothetical protein DLAC_04802 [Tieghemostelium lacteum]
MDNEVKEETRIVKLSLYLEKSILIILSKELGLIDFSKSHLPIIKWAMNYSLVFSKDYSTIRWDLLNFLNQIQIPNVQYYFDIETDIENNVHNNKMSHKNFETKSLILKSNIRLDCTNFSDFRDAVILLDPIDLVLQSLYCSDAKYPHLACHSISKHNSRYESVKIIDTPISLYTFYRLLQSPNIHTLHVDLQFHQIYSFYKSYDSNVNSDHFDIEDEVEEDPNENIDLERIEYRKFSEIYYDELDQFEELDGTFDSLFCPFYYDNGDVTPNEAYSQDLWDKCQHLLMNHKTLTNLSICNNDHSCWGGCNKKPPKGFIHYFKVLINNLSPSIKALGLVMEYLSSKNLNDILDNNQRLNEIILFGNYINTHIQPMLTQKCYQFKPKLIKTTNDNIKITIHKDF